MPFGNGDEPKHERHITLVASTVEADENDIVSAAELETPWVIPLPPRHDRGRYLAWP